MENVNGWCFRGIYKGGLWENDLHVSALQAASSWIGIVIPSSLVAVLNHGSRC